MNIAGYQGTSLIDYPKKISAVVFMRGCNLSCPYCHNKELLNEDDPGIINPDELFQILKDREGKIDAVVFSGGEPSLYKSLIPFMKRIKEETKLSIKLDTNGLEPVFIEQALPHLDYIAVDIKTEPSQYFDVLGCGYIPIEIDARLLRTKMIIEGSGLESEFRTTMYPPVIKDFNRLVHFTKRYVAKNSKLYLQDCITGNPFTREEMENFFNNLKSEWPEKEVIWRRY